jgi:PAS domain S-box-containing protein
MGKNILLFESLEHGSNNLVKQLNEIGYPNESIRRYYSLAESLSISPDSIDVIFADIQHGQNITPSIKQLKQHFSNTPLVFLSDSNNTDTYLEATRGGAECLLVKDKIDPQQLEKAIAIATERNDMSVKAWHIATEYQRHFNKGPIPMWIVDEKTMQFLIVNNAAVEKYGYSKEEFRNMTILDIRPEEDKEAAMQNYRKGRSDYYDAGYWRHIKKSGEVFYVHIYSHATRFGDKAARLVFLVDVDEKLRSDKKNKELSALIKEQKEQLDGILSSINDAIWSRSADTYELLYGNNAYYRLYGYTNGEKDPYKDQIFDSIYPDDREMFYAAVEELKIKGKTEVVYRYITKDGSLRTLKASGVYKKGINGRQDTIDGITQDITNEKEMFNAVRNSEQNLLTTINNTRDLIWSVDTDLKIIFCNKPYQDFFHDHFGVALDHGDYVLGNWHSESFIARRKEEYGRSLNGESFMTVVEEFFANGKQYYEISSTPIYDVNGKITGVNCVSRDITKQEEQLNRIRKQNEKLKEIAWIQSHKVRGPVATILGLISLIDEEKLDETNKDLVAKMNLATEKLDAIIKEIVHNTKDIDDANIGAI